MRWHFISLITDNQLVKLKEHITNADFMDVLPMTDIDFRSKILSVRPNETIDETESSQNLLEQLESDRGRLINSAAIRRLQQKTQVFPLERNAAVRSRLTHSLEVQQVGRHIVQTIFKSLDENSLTQYGLNGLARPIESLVEMGCLLHDVGNPPFGHFGEAAINQWFTDNIDKLFPDVVTEQALINEGLKNELCHFEGNAQGIRILQSLLELNLTYSQAALAMKYTKSGLQDPTTIPAHLNYLMKKIGWYYSESDYINQLCQTLDIKSGHRHPLNYITEAADDISYCLADIEDSVEKGILSLNFVISALPQEYQTALSEFKLTSDDKMQQAVNDAINQAKKYDNEISSHFFIFLRVKLVHLLVKHCAKRFIDNIKPIYQGCFNHALLEDFSHEHAITHALKQLARKRVFSHKEVEKLELQGYRIISGLLDCYQPLLTLGQSDFANLANKGARNPLIPSRLFNKLPKKYLTAYFRSLAEAEKNNRLTSSIEFYYRCRLIQDYISGMTDQFARDEYRNLMAID